METPQKVDSLFVFEAGSNNTIIKEQNITVQGGTNYFQSPHSKSAMEELTDEDKETVEELAGIFYGDKEKAAEFLQKVKTMKDTDICLLVKKLKQEGVISELSYKKDLWEILHNKGIYKASQRNWTNQVQ